MNRTGLYSYHAVLWQTAPEPVSYPYAQDRMQNLAQQISAGEAEETVWLLEHPPLYSAGTSAKREDLRDPDRFDVFETGRGGQFTYHGPGQRVAYAMLDLRSRGRDVRCFVNGLEQWMINTLARFDVVAERREGRIGVWVVKPDGSEAKIGAIGVRVKRWVTFHGLSINVHPDLSHFTGIVPCGISDFGVTSLHDLGRNVNLEDVDATLEQEFKPLFGPIKKPA